MKRKMFAALALSATLAMGAVPAFAAEPNGTSVEGSGDFKDDSNKATTVVSIKTDASQISATIPMKATIVAKANGGDVTAPTADSYKVTNNSSFDVYITSIQGTAQNGWELLSSDAVSDNTASGAVADVSLTVGPRGADATTTDSPVRISTTKVDMKDATMKIAAKGAADGADTLGLVLAGKTTKVKSVSANAVDAVSIQYTISAQDPTPTPGA